MKRKAMNTTALMGMSGDPAHLGHLDAARKVYGMGYEKVVWLVTPQNPHKSWQPKASFEHRMALANILAEPYPWLEVSDFEAAVTIPDESTHTYTVLERYQKLYPSQKLTFIMGSDNWKEFHKWGRYSSIVVNHGVLVIPRSTVKPEHVQAETDLADLRDTATKGPVTHGHWREAPAISPHPGNATTVRNDIAEGRTNPWITPEQSEYIHRNCLYGLCQPTRA